MTDAGAVQRAFASDFEPNKFNEDAKVEMYLFIQRCLRDMKNSDNYYYFVMGVFSEETIASKVHSLQRVNDMGHGLWNVRVRDTWVGPYAQCNTRSSLYETPRRNFRLDSVKRARLDDYVETNGQVWFIEIYLEDKIKEFMSVDFVAQSLYHEFLPSFESLSPAHYYFALQQLSRMLLTTHSEYAYIHFNMLITAPNTPSFKLGDMNFASMHLNLINDGHSVCFEKKHELRVVSQIYPSLDILENIHARQIIMVQPNKCEIHHHTVYDTDVRKLTLPSGPNGIRVSERAEPLLVIQACQPYRDFMRDHKALRQIVTSCDVLYMFCEAYNCDIFNERLHSRCRMEYYVHGRFVEGFKRPYCDIMVAHMLEVRQGPLCESASLTGYEFAVSTLQAEGLCKQGFLAMVTLDLSTVTRLVDLPLVKQVERANMYYLLPAVDVLPDLAAFKRDLLEMHWFNVNAYYNDCLPVSIYDDLNGDELGQQKLKTATVFQKSLLKSLLVDVMWDEYGSTEELPLGYLSLGRKNEEKVCFHEMKVVDAVHVRRVRDNASLALMNADSTSKTSIKKVQMRTSTLAQLRLTPTKLAMLRKRRDTEKYVRDVENLNKYVKDHVCRVKPSETYVQIYDASNSPLPCAFSDLVNRDQSAQDPPVDWIIDNLQANAALDQQVIPPAPQPPPPLPRTSSPIQPLSADFEKAEKLYLEALCAELDASDGMDEFMSDAQKQEGSGSGRAHSSGSVGDGRLTTSQVSSISQPPSPPPSSRNRDLQPIAFSLN